MKKILLVTATVMLAYAAFPQGQVVFDNYLNAADTSGDAPGAVAAPIYGVDPACPTCYKFGNVATTNPQTSGTQTYGGTKIFDSANVHYTATLWALKSTSVTGAADLGNNNLNLVGITTLRSNTSGTSQGRVANPTAGNPVVTDVAPGTLDRATFQVRVWNDQGGTILTWADAVAAAQQGRTQIGYSQLFTVPYALGSANNPTPNLAGLTSFQLFTLVPEPSVIALGVLSAGCLFLLRRRK